MTHPGVYLWRGRTYIGQRAVAEAAGVAVATVSSHLRDHGHLDRLGTGRGTHGGARPSHSRPVCIGGRSWPSISAFARSIGITPRYAQKAIREGRTDKLLAALMAADARRAAA